MGTILLVILVLLLVGAFPGFGFHSYGYMPFSLVGLLVLILLILLVTGHL